jgi:hypothetical protein
MFETTDEAGDQALARRREARRRELRSLFDELARVERCRAHLVQEADERGDWQAAGYSSSAEWLAEIR